MKIVNETYYRTAWVVSKIRPRDLSATFVVKAAYQLHPGSALIAQPEGERPTGDVPVEGGPAGSLYYESDMAPLKLQTDLLLVGSAHAPGGRPVTTLNVEFHVGSWKKRLMVTGDRRKATKGAGSTGPAVFTTMSLGYQNAFGGANVARNSLGKGAGDGASAEWLPNIESPSRSLWSDNPDQEPAGFGPIPRMWPQRHRNLGTFSEAYMRERWPWFPADFDFNHFNAAPIDQRLDTPLRGDELLRFVNLHSGYPDYQSQLRGDRPQLFLRDGARAGEDPDGARLREVGLVLDTLWVDIDLEKLVLVWRGVAPVADLKLRDVAELHIVSGDLARQPIGPAEYAAQLKREALAIQETEAAEEKADAAENKASDEEAAAFHKEMQGLQMEYDRAAAEQSLEAAALMRQQGMSPALLDRPPSMTLAQSDFADVLRGVSRFSPEQAAALAPLIPQMVAMAPPAVEPLEEEAAWTRDRVKDHLEAGADFFDQVLDGLDLTGLDFAGARLAGASLARARLSGCNFSGADLRDANLSGADLTGTMITDADCTDADFTNAIMDAAHLSRSTLTAAVFCGASLKKAQIVAVTGHGADFSSADLSAAIMRENQLTQPDFRASTLVDADFTGAVMPNATLEEARAAGIVMTGADVSGLRASRGPDFSGGDFRNLRAEGSQWEHATLDDAQFQGAFLKGANFSAASLRRVNFGGANMPKAVFEEAVLENCVLLFANLFRGSFERATLRRTDLRRANLYEVEFWDVSGNEVLLDGANLKMTKLAGR